MVIHIEGVFHHYCSPSSVQKYQDIFGTRGIIGRMQSRNV